MIDLPHSQHRALFVQGQLNNVRRLQTRRRVVSADQNSCLYTLHFIIITQQHIALFAMSNAVCVWLERVSFRCDGCFRKFYQEITVNWSVALEINCKLEGKDKCSCSIESAAVNLLLGVPQIRTMSHTSV